jgi:hypothetical protein
VVSINIASPKGATVANATAYQDRIRVGLGTNLTTSLTDDGWETICPTHIEYWESARSLLKDSILDIESSRIKVDVDWHPIIRQLHRFYKTMQRLEKATDDENWIKAAKTFPKKTVEIYFNISIQTSDQDIASRYYPSHAVEYYLHDVFLIMNIASPASCNFSNTTIRSEIPHLNKEIRLSNYHFEAAMQQSRDGKWPSISFLPLEDVIRWFRSVRRDRSLVPSNRNEKVLFSILHITNTELSPATIIWIFHAFETLFDTKVGENFRSLVSRIELLLQPNDSEIRFLRKGMRDLYNLRSAFVHGGLDIIHPMHSEFIDKSIEGIYLRWLRAVDFGFQIILASLQEIIRRGLKEPVFKEVLCEHGKA